MIVSEPHELLWSFVNSRLGTPLSSDLRLIGLVAGDCLRAVAAYNAWVGRTCCFHGAIDDPSAITRTFLRAIFEYPFEKCDVSHMFSLVSSENQRSINFCTRSGFKEVQRLVGAGEDGHDMVVLMLQRNECKWLRGTHGKEIQGASGTLHPS